jgi:hypothetical protein
MAIVDMAVRDMRVVHMLPVDMRAVHMLPVEMRVVHMPPVHIPADNMAKEQAREHSVSQRVDLAVASCCVEL